MTTQRGFGSDNHSGIHPRILAAIARANEGHAPSYGTDTWTQQASALMKRQFGAEAETFFVFNGTAANVLALGALVESYHSILASSLAHIWVDECGAPEKNLGAKVIAVETPDGKLTVDLLRPHLIRRGDQHASQAKVISITQPTEVGTVYSALEIRALSDFARKEGLLLHMDGARLVNAVASLGCTLREITTDCGVDVLSLGGTKNGLMFGEAVIFLRPQLSDGFKYARKQMMQLPSKTRFVAAQFLEFLGTDLWLENARHANHMAQLLRRHLTGSRYAALTQLTQANGVFVRLPKPLVARLKETAFFYVWNEHTFECRLMCTWDTEESDVEKFAAQLQRLGDENSGCAITD